MTVEGGRLSDHCRRRWSPPFRRPLCSSLFVPVHTSPSPTWHNRYETMQVLLGGRTFLRRVFEVAAASKSDEVFISLGLLSVTGASLLTQKAGFSDTLGAFVSGILLSETNFKAQVEAVCICVCQP